MKNCKLIAVSKEADEIFTEDIQKQHGRIEQRTTKLYKNFKAINPEWNQLLTELIVVKRHRQIFNTKKKCYKDSSEISYYVSCVSLTAKRYKALFPNQWVINLLTFPKSSFPVNK